MYKRKSVKKLVGNERFINIGNKHFTILDFWQYGFSNLNSNVLRGALAEFLVENAIKDIKDINVRNPWGDYDVETKGGVKIEVKCSAYLQDWDQKDLTKPIFSGLKAKELYWNDAVGKQINKEADYKADVYVLALQNNKDTETLNLIDLDQWSFFVLSKEQIKKITNNGNSVSLSRLLKTKHNQIPFEKLSESILEKKLKEIKT